MKHSKAACLAVACVLVLAPSGAAFAGPGPVGNLVDSLVAWASSLIGDVSPTAAGGPTETGQPGFECEDFAGSPGQASSAPGSAFNEDGVAHAHYAGEQDQNTINIATSSQYDTACAKVPSSQ